MGLLASARPVFGCPDRGTLMDFGLGKLPAPKHDAVALHVLSCDRCEEVLETLQGQDFDDRLVARLRLCLMTSPAPDGSGYTGMDAMAGTVLAPPDNQEPTASDWDLAYEFGGQVDRSFGQYEVRGEISRGGMGVVYLARQMPLKRMVALKMILAGPHATSQAVARFFREGTAVARLRHPNVVQVYEFGEHVGLPYYSMELVEGGSLRDKLASGPLGPRQAAEVVRTLAEAVEYAHGEGVVHRDLKPANILLGTDGTPKVADFGLAKLLDTESDGGTITIRTGPDMILGTPSYMSPEQAAGVSAEIGPATDIYSLGAILYETLTGRPPFSGSRVKVLELVGSTPPATPSSLRPGIPFWLESVCLKCLEKSPADRYPSAQALADDLGRWLRDERPEGVPSVLTRLGRGLRRHVAGTLVGLSLVTAGAPLIYAGVSFYRKDPDRTIGRIQADLARGQAVTLIGETGGPRWSRPAYEKRGTSPASIVGGTFTITSWPLYLLELLPDSQSDRYKITAEVRHDRSDTAGEVGIYFAHHRYPGRPHGLQFFTQLTFNAVRGEADFQARLPKEFKSQRPPRGNSVWLFPHLVTEGDLNPEINWTLSGTDGPRFDPLWEENGRWHKLEMIVTPEAVTARWNGQTFSVASRDIREMIQADFTAYPPPKVGGLGPDSFPEFKPRGGLGLYILSGSASFRSVKVTPL